MNNSNFSFKYLFRNLTYYSMTPSILFIVRKRVNFVVLVGLFLTLLFIQLI